MRPTGGSAGSPVSKPEADMMIKELDLVVLRESVPEYGLKPGDVGTVVLVHKKAEAFEVKFLTPGGETIGIAT